MKRTLANQQNRSSFMSSSSPYHPSPRKEGKSRDKDKEKEKEKEKDQREKELMSSTSSGENESVGLRTSTSIDSSLLLASKRKSLGPSPLTPNSSRGPGTPFIDSDPSLPENPFPSMEIADKEGGGIPPDMDESTKWLAQQLQTLTVFLKQEYAQRAYFERAIEQKFEELENNQKDLENRVMVLEATIAIKTITKKGTSKKKKETLKEKSKDQEKDQEKKPEVGVFRHRRTASNSSQPTQSPVSSTQANPLNSQSAPADELSLEGEVSLEDEEVQASDPKSKKKKKTTLRGDPRQKKKSGARGFFGLITKDKDNEQQDHEPEEEEKESETLNASEAIPEVPKAQPRKYKKLMTRCTPWNVKRDIFGIWEDIPMHLERALESGAAAPPFMITSFTYLAQNLKEPKLFTTEFTHPEYQELLTSLQECQEKNTREDAFWGFQNPQFIGLLLRQYVRSFSESLTTAKLWQPLMEIGSIPDPSLREMLLRSAFLGLPQGYQTTLETLITFLTPYLKLHPGESEELAKVFGNLLIANNPDETPEAAAPYLTEERKDDVSPPVTPTASSTPREEEVEEPEVEEDVPEGEKPKGKKNKKKEEGERRAERVGSDVRFAGVADKKIVSVTKVLKEKKPVFDEPTLKEFMKIRKTNVMETCLEHSEELFQLEGFDLEYFVDSTFLKKIMHASLRWLLLTLVDPVYPLMCDEVFISVMLFTHPYFFSSERFLGLLCKIYEDGNVEDAFVEEQHHQEKEHRKKMKEKVKRQMSGGVGSGVKGKGGAMKLRKLKEKESVEQLTRQETEKEMEKEKEKLKKEEEKEEKEKDDDKGGLLSSVGSFGEDRRLSGTNFDEDGDDKKKKRRRAKDKDKEKEKEAGDEEVKKLKGNVLKEIRSLGGKELKDPKKKKESKRDRKSKRDPLAGAPPGLNLSSPRPISSPRVLTPSQSAEEPSQTSAARCLFPQGEVPSPQGESGDDVVVGQTDDEPVPIPNSDSSPPHSDFSASTPSNPPPPHSPTRSPSSPPLSRPRAKTSRDKFSTSPRMGTLGRRASPVRARLSSLSPRNLPSSPSSPRNKSSPKGRDGKSSSPTRSSSPNLGRQTQQTSSPVLGASPRGGKVGGRSTSPFLGASPMLSPRRGNSPRKSPDGFSTSSPITEAQDEGGNPIIDIPRRGRSLSSARDNQIVMPPGTPPGTRNSTPRGKVPRKKRSARPTSLKAPLDSPLSLKEEEQRASGGPIEKEESSLSVKAIKQQMEKAIEESTTTKPRTSSDVQVGSVRNKWPHGKKGLEGIEEEDKEGEKEEEKEGEEGDKEEEKEEKAKEEEIVKTPALDDEDSILEHTANAVAAVGGLTFEIEFDDKGSLTKLSDFDCDPSLLGPYSPQSSPRSVSKENDPPIAPSHEGKLVRNLSSPAITVTSPDREEEEGENGKKKEKKVEGAEGLWLDAVRMRVLVLLKKWLEEFMNVLITSEGFEKLLKSFITRFDSHETIENRELWQYVRMCGIKLGNTKAQLIRNISFYHNQPFNLKSATKLEVAQPARQDILAYSAKDVAAQMTLIDQGMFKSIPWTEFIQKNFEKPQTGPFFNLMCDRWNQECHWVAGEVLTRSTANERSQMITYMITLGEECLTLKNFGMCFAVVAGLNLSAIARLKQTWDKLPKKWYARFHKLELLCSLENNYESYRSTYEAALKPKVPYIAVYPKDLTAIEDNIHTFIENTKMVNFNKLRLLWKLLKEIRETQRAVYNIPSNKMLHSTLKTLPGFTEKSLYDLSLKVEPRK